MIRPIEVKALEKYIIWIKFSNGHEGTIDLKRYAGKGVFKAWDKEDYFRSVKIGEHGGIEWGEEIDLCPDSLYLRLTSRKPEDLFPTLLEEKIDA